MPRVMPSCLAITPAATPSAHRLRKSVTRSPVQTLAILCFPSLEFVAVEPSCFDFTDHAHVPKGNLIALRPPGSGAQVVSDLGRPEPRTGKNLLSRLQRV